jgi:hypothetical protein
MDSSSEDLRIFELNTGAKIPSVGLGTWLAAPGVVYDAISTAVNVYVSFHSFLISCFLSCFLFILIVFNVGWISTYRLCSNLWQ